MLTKQLIRTLTQINGRLNIEMKNRTGSSGRFTKKFKGNNEGGKWLVEVILGLK